MNPVQIFFIILIIGIFIVSGIYTFVKISREQKISNVKEWLKIAVALAEKELGGGTGQLKLRYVYNTAVEKFPWIVSFVTFEVFSVWVDEALDWMKVQLETNEAISNYINK